MMVKIFFLQVKKIFKTTTILFLKGEKSFIMTPLVWNRESIFFTGLLQNIMNDISERMEYSGLVFHIILQ